MSTEIYVATETAIVGHPDGSIATIAKDSTRLPADDPIVKKYPGFFAPDGDAPSEPAKKARK